MLIHHNKHAKGPPGGILPWIIWAVASLFYLYEYVLRVAPSVMVHELMIHFQVTAGGLGGLVALYYYAYSPMQLVVGLLLDHLGGRKVLPFAVGLAALGCVMFGTTENHWIAGTGRLLMGVGSAFAFVGALYVATNWFPQQKFAMLSGLTTMLGMLGAASGQAPVAFVSDRIGWQTTWIVFAVSGAGILILFLFLIPHRPHWAKKIKEDEKESQPSVFTHLRGVLLNPQTWWSGLFGGMIYVPTSVFAALWGVPFIEVAYGIPRITAAAAVSMIFIGWIFGAPLAGWWSDKIKRRKPPLILGTIGVLITSSLVIYTPDLSIPLVFTLMFLTGLFSGGQVVCFAIGYESNPHNAKGSALAVTNMLVMITGALLQPAVGYLLDYKRNTQHHLGITQFTTSDFHFALTVVPASVLIALFFAFITKETHGKMPS